MSSKAFNPASDIPDLGGKVVLVTGGNTGIGKATVHAIAAHKPQRIYLTARRRTAGESAASELRTETGFPNIEVLDLDLASLNSVKACADRFNASESRLDILFLNAGVGNIAHGVTREGYEIQFGTNHVGHALFTQLVLPKMLQTLRENPKADVRIVATSSNASFPPMLPKGGLALEDMRRSNAHSTMTLYAHSKLANILFIRKLAQMYPGIVATSVHPGVVRSDIWNKGAGGLFSTLYKPVVWFTSVTTEEGARPQLWCATAPTRNRIETGQFYQPSLKRRELKGPAGDQKLADDLWAWTNHEIARFNKSGWPESR